jgi:hypothetical protein
MMIRFFVGALFGACALAFPIAGLAQAGDEAAVRRTVEDFLERLGNHELDTLAADFAPKALIVVTRQRQGAFVNGIQTAEEWLAGLRASQNPTKFEEPITNVKVTIESGHLAHLRADFQVLRDGKAVSHGVDHFTLVREPTGWKIALIAYTSLPVTP